MRSDLALSPWPELNRMWNLMDRVWPTRESDLVTAGFPIDLYKQDDRLVIRASVPGVKPEDLNVSLEQGVLTITGETRDAFVDNQSNRMFHREHSYGKFLRSVRLPADVNDEQIDAQFENGVLMISLPLIKPQQPKSKQIAVRHSDSTAKPIGEKAYADRPGDGRLSPSDEEKVGTTRK